MLKKVVLLTVLLSIVGCSSDDNNSYTPVYKPDPELHSQAIAVFKPISSADRPELDPAKVELGKYLYFDTLLSQDGNISCNSCHNLNTYGVDNLAFSPGDDGTLGGRNSPTVFHAALHNMQFWDGRAKDVEEQAGGPILNPVEHNMRDEQQVEERLREVEWYRTRFAAVYGTDSEPITFDHVTNAIGAFERTLLPSSRFDTYLEGDLYALTEQEQQGLQSFMAVGCMQCHNGIALGGNRLQKFGFSVDYWTETKSTSIDNGLFDLTGKESDKYVFKVPGLRNITHTAPYFHDGSVRDLKEAVRVMAKLQHNKELTSQELDDITVFLASLSSDIPDAVKKSPFNP